jgi:hypothetical protein
MKRLPSRVDDVALTTERKASVDLYWLPLGTGGQIVRAAGHLYEAVASRRASRDRLDLYHAALEVQTAEATFAIEVMPYVSGRAARAGKGVVRHGPVGSPLASRIGLFRYELRRWRDGVIFDLEHAPTRPVQITDDPAAARRLLDLVPLVPMSTWGRDELGGGEMWTSNSVIAWLIVQAGAWTADLRPPAGGRAPGWDAGVRIAARREVSPATPAAALGEDTQASFVARQKSARERGPVVAASRDHRAGS